MAMKKLLAALSGVAIFLAWTNPAQAADLTLKVTDKEPPKELDPDVLLHLAERRVDQESNGRTQR